MKKLLPPESLKLKHLSHFLLLLLFTLAFAGSANAQAPPANDNCPDAILLTPNQACSPVNGSTTGATQSMLACGAGGVADDDVWFKFVATRKQHAIKVTGSAGFDAVVEIFSGSCSNFNSLGCMDATSTGQFEMSQPDNLIIGNTYFIRVYHYKSGAGTGNFTICLSDPVNDFCEGAAELIPGNSCTPVTGNLLNATQSLAPCTGTGAANDVWYKFIATGLAHDITVVSGSSFSIAFEVFSGNFCNSLSSIKCQTSVNTTGYTMELGSLVPGQAYYIRVYTSAVSNTSRPFTVCVKERTLPAGASCGNAINIPAIPFNSGTQTTCGKGDYYSSNFLNNRFIGEDMVFKLEVTNAPVAYFVKLNRLNAGAQSLGVGIFLDCPNPAYNPVNYIGDSPITTDTATITLKGNGTYYFVVDNMGNSNTCGTFNLEILPNTKAPANDECINAISLTVGQTCIPYNGTSAYATQSRPGLAFPNSLNYPTVADDDVWFSFVAKSTHHKIVLDREINFDYLGVMELFSGTCNNLTPVQGLYNSGGNKFDIDAPNLVIGQKYYIRVYDRLVGWSSGRFTICVSELIPNDECAGAITLPVFPQNVTPTPLFATSAVATQSLPACGGSSTFAFPNDDVWFKFTATSPYNLIKVNGLDKNGQVGEFNFMPELELFDGSCGTLNSKACSWNNRYLNNGEIHSDNLIPGNTYYLRVYENRKDIYFDKFTVFVQEKAPPVAGALCSNAIPITAFPFTSGTQTTCDKGNEYGTSCNSAGGSYEEMVYKLEVTNAPVSYRVNLRSTGSIKTITAFSGCPSPVESPRNCIQGKYFQGVNYMAATNLGNNDTIINEVFTFSTNGTYYLMVEDYEDHTVFAAGTCGTFRLEVSPINAPANETCATAMLLPTGANCSPVAGTTAGANGSGGSQGCYNTGFSDDDVWYKFVATSANHIITIDGSDGFWAGGQLFRGTCTSMVPLFCDAGANPGGTLIIEAENLVPGTTYYISVFDQRRGYGTSGNFTICVKTGAPRPVGSTCGNAVTIPAIPYYSGLQTTCGKGNDFGYFGFNSNSYLNKPAFYGNGEDMDFKFTITNAPVTYNFTLSSPEAWKILRIYDACPVDPFNSPFPALATGPDTAVSANFTFTKNGTYYLITDQWAEPNDPVCGKFRLKIGPEVYYPNDDCAGALPLPVTSTCTPTKGSLMLASKSLPAYCYTYTNLPDVWYKFTAPASRNVSISVKGAAAFQPQVELFSDTCGALKTLGCPDWNLDTTLVANFFKLVPGQTYYFRVLNNAFESNHRNDFEVCVTDYDFVPNSLCAGATTLPVNPANVCNEVSGTTTGSFATAGLIGCSGTADDNAWYQFTATSQSHRVQVKGAIGFDPVVEMFSGNCTSPASIACTDNTALSATENLDVNGLTIGQNYFVRVYHQAPGYGSGNFKICIQERPLPSPNDHCINAVTLKADTICTPVAGSVLHATESLKGCSGTAATDVWYKFLAVAPENTITVANTGNADLVVELLSGSCIAPSSVICRDTAIAGGNEVIKFPGSVVGQEYYVRVYAYNQLISNGDFSICVKTNSLRSVIPVPPALSIFCAGDRFKLPFEVFGSFNAGNVFQAQLSDSAGNFNFTNPVIIGTKATAVSDTFSIALPANSKKSNLYKIRIIASSPAYTSPVLVPLNINAIPKAPVFVTPPAYCQNEAIAPLHATGSNIRWYADAQLKTLLQTGPSFTPPALTDTTRYYITQSTTGCQSLPAIITVIVKPRPNTFFTGLDSVYCASTQPITLTPAVQGGTFSGGLVFGNTFIPALSGNHTISYTLTQNGCTATETRKVIVMPSPPTLTGGNQTICSGSSVPIGMAPQTGFSYSWTPVAGLSNPLIANPVFTGQNLSGQNDTVVKVLHVTDLANGCTSTSYLKIVVKGVMPITLSPNQSVCADRAPMQLPATPTGGTWAGTGVSATGLFDPLMAGPGTHKLIYTLQQNGCSRSDSTLITVTPVPVADAGRDTTLCAGNPVTLGSPAVAGYSYQWLPGTNLDNPSAAMPVFTLNSVSSPTIFTKTLTVTNQLTGCSSTSQVQVTVNPLPVVSAGPDATLCTNTGLYSLQGRPAGGTWSGSAAITGTSLDPTLAISGINRLAYTFNLNGCTVTDSVNITILAAPAALAGLDTVICSGETYALGGPATAGVSYIWTPASGINNPFISNPAFSHQNHTIQNDTLVKVLTATNFTTGCVSRDTVVIIVKPMPLVSAGNDITLCSNAGVYPLAASPAGGTWSGSPALTGSSFDPELALPGIHRLAYTFSANGCTVTDSINIRVMPVPAAIAGRDTVLCSGEPVVLGSVGQPGYSFSWLPVTGLSNSSVANPVFSLVNQKATADTLVKVITVTNLVSGCSSTDTVQVIVKPAPLVNAGNDATVCANSGLLQLQATPAGGIWSGSTSLNGNSFDPALAGPGVYRLAYTLNTTGCPVTDSLRITVQPVLVAFAGPDQVICSGDNIQLGSIPVPGFSYTWSPPSGLANPVVGNSGFSWVNQNTQADTLVKILKVTDLVTGCSSLDSVRIIVLPRPVLSVSRDTTVCLSAQPVQLIGNPLGGTWSGSSGLNGTLFDPKIAGTGKHTIQYSVVQNGCQASIPMAITVLPEPAKPVINLINFDSLGSSVSGTSYQWFLNGMLLNTNAAGLKPAKAGAYRVIVWNAQCLSDTSAAYQYQPIIKTVQPEGLHLYPNPSPGKTRIDFRQQGTQELSVVVYDAIGRPFYSRKFQADQQGAVNAEMDLKPLRNGIYLLVISNGKTTWNRKLVIQK